MSCPPFEGCSRVLGLHVQRCRSRATAGVALDGQACRPCFWFLGMHSCAPGPAGSSRSAEWPGNKTNHQQVVSDRQWASGLSASVGASSNDGMGCFPRSRSARLSHGHWSSTLLQRIARPGCALAVHLTEGKRSQLRTRTSRSTLVDCWPVCADVSSSSGDMTEKALLFPDETNVRRMAQRSGREVDGCGLLARRQKQHVKPSQGTPTGGALDLARLSSSPSCGDIIGRGRCRALLTVSSRCGGPSNQSKCGCCSGVHVTPTAPTLTARHASVSQSLSGTTHNAAATQRSPSAVVLAQDSGRC